MCHILILLFLFFRTDAEEALPDRVFDIGSGAVAHADVIVPSMHRIVYVGEKGAVVDCNFWGDLKRPRPKKNRESMVKE